MKTKVLCVIEISVVFILMIFLFRFANSTPMAMKIIDFFNGRLFPGYASLLIISFILYSYSIRNREKKPIFEKLKYQFDITAYGFFPFFVLSVLLSWIDWNRWAGAVLISIIEIGLLFWFARTVRNRPTWKNTNTIGCFLLFPIALQNATRLGKVIVAVIYFYFFVALSEEILFRGYIQSRLNSVFGHPKHFFGINWGWGLIISSILFGLWHLGAKFDMSAWPHVLWTMFAGLSFGLVREKSESVIAPTILHGIMNYGPQAILFYLFLN